MAPSPRPASIACAPAATGGPATGHKPRAAPPRPPLPARPPPARRASPRTSWPPPTSLGPHERLTRLDDLLFRWGGLPSAQRGLLSHLQALVLCGDRAGLSTGASPHGRPTCACRAQGIYRCDHDRFSPDATATGDDDAYRETFVFGHRDVQHGVVTPDHPLPLQVLLAPGHSSESTLGPTALDRRLKLFTAPPRPATVRATVYDAGLEAQGLYPLLGAQHIAPGLALNPRRGAPPRPTGTAAQVTDAGVPRCPAGLPMRRHRAAPSHHRLSCNGPVKRPTHRQGQLAWGAHVEACPRQGLCQPDPRLGPVISVRTAAAPRLSPPIPRDSAAFKALMAQRTGCERSHSLTKGTDRLAERPCRRATPFLVRLYLASLLEHAPVWLADDRQRLGEAPQALLQTQVLAASPLTTM